MHEPTPARLRNLANRCAPEDAAEIVAIARDMERYSFARAAELLRALDPRATIHLGHDGLAWHASAAVNHDWLMPRLGTGEGQTVEAAVDGLLASLVRTAQRRIAEYRRELDDDCLQAEADTLEGMVAA